MAMIDIKLNPTRKDLVVFAIMWAVFFALLAKLAFSSANTLMYAAAFTGAAFLISIAFNTEQPRRIQMLGLIIPCTLLAIGGAERFLGVAPWTIVWILIVIGGIGGMAILLSKAAGTAIYTTWMFAALPIGWTVSHFVLGLVFFLVMTPIGCILRLTGNDPMERGLDRAATTYWKPRDQVFETSRYFRQF